MSVDEERQRGLLLGGEASVWAGVLPGAPRGLRPLHQVTVWPGWVRGFMWSQDRRQQCLPCAHPGGVQ